MFVGIPKFGAQNAKLPKLTWTDRRLWAQTLAFYEDNPGKKNEQLINSILAKFPLNGVPEEQKMQIYAQTKHKALAKFYGYYIGHLSNLIKTQETQDSSILKERAVGMFYAAQQFLEHLKKANMAFLPELSEKIKAASVLKREAFYLFRELRLEDQQAGIEKKALASQINEIFKKNP